MLDQTTLQSLFANDFRARLSDRWKDWHTQYVAYVKRVQGASEAEWLTPAFQAFLWDSDQVSGIGQGKSVTVEGAYADRDLAKALFELRKTKLAPDLAARAKQLSDAFDAVMERLTPRHSERRPSARLLRLFCGLFPSDALVLLDSHKTNVVRRGFGMKKGGLSTLAQQVLMRGRLREALGPTETVEAQVDQSMFSWLLFERLEREASAEEGEAPVEPGADSERTQVSAADAPVIRMLPVDQQRRGMYSIANSIGTVMQILRFAENGATKDELVDEILVLFPKLKRSSAEMYITLMRSTFGVIELRDGALRPTKWGQQLIDGEDPSDVLAPVLIGRVFGFAQLLSPLRGSEGLPKATLYQSLREIYPRWTSDYIPSGLLGWAHSIGLVETASVKGAAVERLTDAGAYWASGLPADLETRWRPVDADDTQEAPEEVPEKGAAPAKLQLPTFAALSGRFGADPELRRLVFPPKFLAKFDAALRALPGKRFVLLSGLSGTGKTSLARAYANAVCAELKLPIKAHYCQMAVRPDWTDPSGILGYYNPIASTPRFEETEALQLVLAADSRPDLPYFLCLDEMNLARVEHYFAPFLSAMEGRGQLQIHHQRESIDGVPPQVRWPANLFVIGTVNMDETTHPFSDKVLDRAFSFELWDVDLQLWRGLVAESIPTETLDTVVKTLQRLYDALYPARRHFGYRTCDEVLAFCRAAQLDIAEALDAAVMAKVLPKLRGDDTGELPGALDAVHTICREAGLVECARRVTQMQKTLKDQGMARFWA